MVKTAMLTTLALLAGCKSTERPPEAKPAPGAEVAAEPPAPANDTRQPPPASDLPPAVTKTVLGFEVNGAAASTTRRPGDSDEPMASYAVAKQGATIAIYGDVSTQPRRGMLTLAVEGFKPEAGEFKARPRFVRYLDATGNELVMWSGKKGTATLKVDKIVEGTGGAGTKWLASGTFEATGLALELGQQSETKTIDITKGTFTDLEVVSLGMR